MTDMARYYQARPVVSPTVCAATLKTPNFYTTIMKDPCSVLTSAKTLQNDLLFKDSLILCLGPWSEPAVLKLSDPEPWKTAASAHARTCAKVAKAHQSCCWQISSTSRLGRQRRRNNPIKIPLGFLQMWPTTAGAFDTIGP
jgi:hypothetical protein